MSGRCKDCRWWALTGPIETNFGACCYADSENGETYDDSMFALTGEKLPDGSPETVMVFTGPEFGCVHWQAKEGSDG